jgi:hypothetical protein
MSITPTEGSVRQTDLADGEARPLPRDAAQLDETQRVAAAARMREMVRAVNEQILLLAQPSGDTPAATGLADFVCECPRETCFAVVPMTVTEWKAATGEAGYYVAHPEHVGAGDQAVVATDRYAVARSAWPGELRRA